jgi:hypothetical protein
MRCTEPVVWSEHDKCECSFEGTDVTADWKSLLHAEPDKVWRDATKPARPAVDPTVALKARMISGIEKVLDTIDDGEESHRGWYAMKGDVAKVSVRVGLKLLPIEGHDYNTLPRENLFDFYEGVLASIQQGELDEEIKALLSKDQAQPAKARARRADAGKPRAPWSPERRAAYEAAVAAKNKKKVLRTGGK